MARALKKRKLKPERGKGRAPTVPNAPEESSDTSPDLADLTRFWEEELKQMMSADLSSINEAVGLLVEKVLKRVNTPPDQFEEHREFLIDLIMLDEEMKSEIRGVLKLKA